MPTLVLRSLPKSLYSSLKHQATLHRRSVAQEAIHLLQQSLGLASTPFPPPAKGKRPLTRKLLERAIREGRA